MWLPLLVLVALLLLYRWYRQSQILENLSGKYVFITGCDTGFGNTLAKQLDKRGMKVLASCLTEKGAEQLKKETSSQLKTVILDVADSQSVSSAAKWIANIVGDRVNLLPLIMKAKGRIVNVSSCGGRLPNVGGGYCPSKFGVEALSDSLRRELRDFGVKISIIEPGAFRTALGVVEPHLKNLERLWTNLPENMKHCFGEQYYYQYAQGLSSLLGSANPKLYRVTDCMEHALTAVHPWTRYSPGWDCKLYYLPVSYLPTVLSDYLLCRSSPKPAHGLM
ncbi:retinol dehydrogenase 7-like isoform X2 [Hyla sarda]|uniref:retinol dehydrogenase 7-like isoform X2 n=1 Tax=Hyla sarda TaxID=327740 RepID=UPI0024C2D906|nr:retinol dehydrogenase 7-like isoform X2 [Hyla sarda]